MSGGVVRVAARKVSATNEILMGSILGIGAGLVWRQWHVSYKATIDNWYKEYNAKQKISGTQ